MINNVRKTIILPETFYLQAQMMAASRGLNFSEFVRFILRENITDIKRDKDDIDPLKTLGRFKIGIKKPYKKRTEIYEK